MLTRRDWLGMAGQAALAATIASRLETEASGRADHGKPVYCLFSKPLPELAWGELGRAVKEAGFEGVDLTVRPEGHVLPERAVDDLPRAIEALEGHGLKVPMITTALSSASDPHARPLLETAARHGVRYFKTGYWQYESIDVRATVARVAQALAGLADLARECGIQMGVHNHAAYVGAALWDISPAMDRLDPKWAGYYFDPRHAVAEGGGGAWKTATHLVMPRLKMLAIKDCVWQKTPKGWTLENCPLGKGLVEWAWVGSTLRGSGFSGPISIHIEYEVAGSTPANHAALILGAARQDLDFARRFLG
jgi:L-ribulose-5-phosphate 3-epimerase